MTALIWVFYLSFWMSLVTSVATNNTTPALAAVPCLIVWLMLMWERAKS